MRRRVAPKPLELLHQVLLRLLALQYQLRQLLRLELRLEVLRHLARVEVVIDLDLPAPAYARVLHADPDVVRRGLVRPLLQNPRAQHLRRRLVVEPGGGVLRELVRQLADHPRQPLAAEDGRDFLVLGDSLRSAGRAPRRRVQVARVPLLRLEVGLEHHVYRVAEGLDHVVDDLEVLCRQPVERPRDLELHLDFAVGRTPNHAAGFFRSRNPPLCEPTSPIDCPRLASRLRPDVCSLPSTRVIPPHI
ncbi:adenine phosphoribosyltransferase [Babesia caballi]|uniref:Adenine phosphoribosyltransferase n=1 Tax=Babesia caballi TaxID=5871 RepID=A0AAV4LYB3_BABCB|nr:adenine phosphoribosyltransferase [Babesia caballi]